MPDRVGAGASFHGGGLVTDKPDSPHLLAPKIKARMYFGIAANDDQRQPDAKDKLKEAFAAAKVPAEIEVYPAASTAGACRTCRPRTASRSTTSRTPSAPGASWWRSTEWHSPEFRPIVYVPQEGGVTPRPSCYIPRPPPFGRFSHPPLVRCRCGSSSSDPEPRDAWNSPQGYCSAQVPDIPEIV